MMWMAQLYSPIISKSQSLYRLTVILTRCSGVNSLNKEVAAASCGFQWDSRLASNAEPLSFSYCLP